MRAIRLALATVLGLSIGLPAAGFASTAIYEGSWNNATFGSSGPARFEITTAGNSFSVTMDLDGNVFGGADPDPVTVSGMLDLSGNGVFNLDDHELFGDVVGSISGGTVIEATATNIPVFGFVSASLTGTISPTEIALEYDIEFVPFFVPNMASGTIAAQLVPVPAALPLFMSGLGLAALSRRKRVAS